MQQYNYSIIIPHKNIPTLLKRCLNSIPKRDDVQVIIVDDNSDPEKVDFKHFPGLGCSNVEVYFDKTGGGAGWARNVGLEHARGEWVLFADADDFFTDDFNHALDLIDDTLDCILFKSKCRLSNDLNKVGKRQTMCDWWNSNIDKYVKGELSYKLVLLRFGVPWGKFIRNSFIKKYEMRYEEVPFSNDIAFATQLLLHLDQNKFKVSNLEIYCLTERDGSLVNTNSISTVLCRFQVAYRQYETLKNNGMGYLMDFNYKYHSDKAKELGFFAYLKFINTAIKQTDYIPPTCTIEKKFRFRYPYIFFLKQIILTNKAIDTFHEKYRLSHK